MIISLIFAMNGDRIIGNKGDMPWYLPSDLKRFRTRTTGHPVIMGRKTFESIVDRNGEPLRGRHNIVITRDPAPWNKSKNTKPYAFRNCSFVSSLAQGISLMHSYPEVFIIGGAEIYAEALPIANKLYFTQVGGKFEGDTFFPQFNMHEWTTVHDELVTTDNHPYAFSILERMQSRATLRTSGSGLVNPTFAKSAGYGKTIAEIIEAGICPFCPEHFLWHPWPILHRSGNWIITRSGWPYENAEHHFLIIGDNHLTEKVDMAGSVDDAAVNQLICWAKRAYGLTGYFLGSRSGDTDLTGATVQHLHLHLIQAKPGLTVLFPIG